jgi:hypothetical protein
MHVIALVPRNLAFTFGKPGLYTAVTRARQTLTIMGALEELPDIIEREDIRRCTALKSLLGLALKPELKPELRPELKPGLNPGRIIDFDAKFKEIADKMALAGELTEDSSEAIDRG